MIHETHYIIGYISSCYDDIEAAYQKLYHAVPDKKMQEQFSNLCAKSVEELKSIYDSQRRAESLTEGQMISYIGDGVNINAENVADVAARIREKMKENQ